ncbi:MAG: TadE/TadG family type IV pilus assembly protein [Pseudomonadota bacterium]
MTVSPENISRPSYLLRLKRLWRDREGVAAVEFALLGPVFFMMMFAIIEMVIVMLATLTMEKAVRSVSEQMQADRNVGIAFDFAKYKAIACNDIRSAFVTSCNADDLALSIWYVGHLPNGSQYQGTIGHTIVDFMDPTESTLRGDGWLVSIGMTWPVILPTTRLLIDGDEKPQVVATFLSIVSREIENI